MDKAVREVDKGKASLPAVAKGKEARSFSRYVLKDAALHDHDPSG
jgi:hypothetical protein